MTIEFDDANGSSTDVSLKNPLPTTVAIGASANPTILQKQCVFIAHGVSCAAAASNFSKIQIWNPSNSGKILVLYIANMWHTSGTVIYKVSLANAVLSASESATTKQNLFNGSTKTAKAKIYTKNSDATSATDVISNISSTSTASNGSNVTPLTLGFCAPNSGITIESTTANMAINAALIWAEVDLADSPNFA